MSTITGSPQFTLLTTNKIRFEANIDDPDGNLLEIMVIACPHAVIATKETGSDESLSRLLTDQEWEAMFDQSAAFAAGNDSSRRRNVWTIANANPAAFRVNLRSEQPAISGQSQGQAASAVSGFLPEMYDSEVAGSPKGINSATGFVPHLFRMPLAAGSDAIDQVLEIEGPSSGEDAPSLAYGWMSRWLFLAARIVEV